jgi:hypothetical protein
VRRRSRSGCRRGRPRSRAWVSVRVFIRGARSAASEPAKRRWWAEHTHLISESTGEGGVRRSGRHELGSEPLEAVRSHKPDHVPGAGSHGIVRRQRYARTSPEPGAPPSRDAPPIVAKMPPEQQTDPPHPPQPPLTVPLIDPQASRSWVSCRSATWSTRPSSCTCRYTSRGACARPRSASRSRA